MTKKTSSITAKKIGIKHPETPRECSFSRKAFLLFPNICLLFFTINLAAFHAPETISYAWKKLTNLCSWNVPSRRPLIQSSLVLRLNSTPVVNVERIPACNGKTQQVMLLPLRRKAGSCWVNIGNIMGPLGRPYETVISWAAGVIET